MKTISANELRRRVFNHALLECFSKIHESCCGDCCTDNDDPHHDRNITMAKKMSDAFFGDMLALNGCTINQTKARLSEAVTFIQDCINISEAIAQDKADIAKEENMEIPEDQKIELSPEDEELIEKLFDEKGPEVQIDAVRDATVKALLAEDKKAQEIKDSLSIAQSQVAAGGDPKVMEETVSRLSGRGPTSLMNAIMNSVSAAAVRDVNENAKTPVSVGTVMAENATEIKNRAIMIYSLYECSSVFGIKSYTNAEVKKIAEEIYYGK